MAPSRNEMIDLHEDRDFFRESVLFTAGQTGLNAALIEKDYYCTILLQYLYQQPNSPLIFRGGTCIGKVYADFYRPSEDLDFLIPTPPEADISIRRIILSMVEAIAEKLRAALTRLEPAIRDFSDIDFLVSQQRIDITDPRLLNLVAEKLKVPENPPVNLSPSRKEKLAAQINVELKPVLRPSDFESFDLDRAFGLVARIAGH